MTVAYTFIQFSNLVLSHNNVWTGSKLPSAEFLFILKKAELIDLPEMTCWLVFNINLLIILTNFLSLVLFNSLTLLHSDWPKLHRVLANLSAIGLSTEDKNR